MRGGKRIGSGRKKGEETKRISVPLAVLPEVEKLIEKHKKKLKKQLLSYEKKAVNQTPQLTKEQLLNLQYVMRNCSFAKNKRQAKKLTNTPEKCKDTFLKIIHLLTETQVLALGNIPDLYVIEE